MIEYYTQHAFDGDSAGRDIGAARD